MADCACGYTTTPLPPSRDAAIASTGAHPQHRDLLELLEADGSKWMSVLRCRQCGRYWAEAHVSSGHAEISYHYPIETDDPHAWLAAAENLY
jgi:hypothetical protein